MGIRGELFTMQVTLENRSYFFNVKENRAGDLFLQIVESKKGDGADFDRHQIAIFEEDMPRVLKGLDDSLKFIEKARKEKAKAKAEKKVAKAEKFGAKKRIVRGKKDGKASDGIKRTGKIIHITSKMTDEKAESDENPEK